MDLTAIILAGGLGTRLRSVVPDLPKPMALINGIPFLEYQMSYWIKQGVSHFILSVGYKSEVIVDHFSDTFRDIPVDYVIENEPLGTGGGLLLAAEKLQEVFVVLNGDTFFEVNLKELISFHAEKYADWSFSLFRTNEIGRYMGMDIAEDGKILALKSKSPQTARLANGGAYLVEPSALSQFKEKVGSKLSLEDDILPLMLKNRSRMFGSEQNGRFIDIGIPDDYFRASEVLDTV